VRVDPAGPVGEWVAEEPADTDHYAAHDQPGKPISSPASPAERRAFGRELRETEGVAREAADVLREAAARRRETRTLPARAGRAPAVASSSVQIEDRMRLPGNYTAPRTSFADFVGATILPVRLMSEGQIIDRILLSARQRWPGLQLDCVFETKRAYDDPFVGVDPHVRVAIVRRWRKVVVVVSEPEQEIAVADLPANVVGKPPLGKGWYENVAFVLVPPAFFPG
jgi:hypothetical protein